MTRHHRSIDVSTQNTYILYPPIAIVPIVQKDCTEKPARVKPVKQSAEVNLRSDET